MNLVSLLPTRLLHKNELTLLNFISAGEDETVESLAKNNWNPHLVILEQNLNSNEDDRGKEFGLSASQIGQILDALIAWTDREFR